MKSTITLKTGIYEEVIEPHLFSGGELNVQIPPLILFCSKVTLIANIADAEGIMALALVRDAISHITDEEVHLYLGYVPYARQDRVCNPGEALSIKVFCGMINAMEFDSVTILDPHSDVTAALLDNVSVVESARVLSCSSLARNLSDGKITLVAPDAGATKKVVKVAQTFGGLEIIQGFKRRDTRTGKLSGFGFIGDVEGKDLLIVDDICDGGGTFVALTEKLKEGGAESVSLYVSHGIFSKGLDCLLDNGTDKIYTTNSFNHGYGGSSTVEYTHGYTGDELEIINWL